MQHVVRGDLREQDRQLGAIGIVDRVQDNIHLLQHRPYFRIGQQLLAELGDMARARDLVRMLAARINN